MFQAFRREIERRIDVIPKIVYEPKLLPDDDSKYILPPTENSIYPSSFYCRQRAVDDVKKLGNSSYSFVRDSVALHYFINHNLETHLNSTKIARSFYLREHSFGSFKILN